MRRKAQHREERKKAEEEERKKLLEERKKLLERVQIAIIQGGGGVKDMLETHENCSNFFHDAAFHGFLPGVQWVLQNKKVPRAAPYAALCRAVDGGHVQVAKCLLEACYQRGGRPNKLENPAIQKTDLPVLLFLVEHELVGLRDARLQAAEAGWLRGLQELMRQKCMQEKGDFEKMLIGAAQNRRVGVSEWLVERSTDDVKRVYYSAVRDRDPLEFLDWIRERLTEMLYGDKRRQGRAQLAEEARMRSELY
jgi:hypothetical protein